MLNMQLFNFIIFLFFQLFSELLLLSLRCASDFIVDFTLLTWILFFLLCRYIHDDWIHGVNIFLNKDSLRMFKLPEVELLMCTDDRTYSVGCLYGATPQRSVQ